MAAEGTSTNPDNLQKNYVEEKEKTANLKRKNILLENDLKKIRKTADSGQQNNEIEEIKRKYQQLIEENNKKDKKIISLEQERAKKNKNKRGKKKFKPGRLQREKIKKEKAAATTTSVDASLDEVKQSFVEKASESSDDSRDEFVQSSSNMTKAVDNNLNYVKFIQIKNEWWKTGLKFSCCDNKCINTNKPIGNCIEGNGFGKIINEENIEYTNCLEEKRDSRSITLFAQHGRITKEGSEAYKIENFSFNNNDIFGCGIVFPPNNKPNEFPYVFFTQNGKQIGKSLMLTSDSYNGDSYRPCIGLQRCSIQANFGNNLETKPFIYDISKHCIPKEFYRASNLLNKHFDTIF